MEGLQPESQPMPRPSGSAVNPLIVFAGWVLVIVASVALPFGEAFFAGLQLKYLTKNTNRPTS